MSKLLSVVACAATFLLLSCGGAEAPSSSGVLIVNDGDTHGEPPFLLEEGWTPLLNGKDLGGWEIANPEKKGQWVATKAVVWGGTDAPEQLTAMPEPGDRIVNTAVDPAGDASNIYTTRKFGDMELYVEFMVPANANSGLMVHGLYELQIWDSYGKEPRFDTDKTGSLYHYEGGPISGWDGAVMPLVRAEHPHGQWNSFHIWFQAPSFDESGKKTANARFLRVLHNGQLIHENQERLGRTTATMDIPEAPENPIMLQGDHGAVAYRNIYVRPLRPMSR